MLKAIPSYPPNTSTQVELSTSLQQNTMSLQASLELTKQKTVEFPDGSKLMF